MSRLRASIAVLALLSISACDDSRPIESLPGDAAVGGGGNAGGSAVGGGGTSNGGSAGTSMGGSGGVGGGSAACNGVAPTGSNCEPGACLCGDSNECFAEAVASSCCVAAVTCDPASPNPVATINHPANGETRQVADGDVPFAGVATDAQDGALTGAALVWTSSLSGEIGTGETFNQSMTAGVHVITLTATDSDGNTGTDSITLTMQ